MNKPQVMEKFGFFDSEEFDALLLDLGIDPELETLTDEQIEAIKNHVTIFASSLAALKAEANNETVNGNGNGHQTYTPPSGSMTVITNQGLQLAKETGLQISQGALETLSQMTFDKGRLDAAFLENAYWLGLLRQQNQLRAANTEKFIRLLQAQLHQNINIEKLATDAGLLNNSELVKKLSLAASSDGTNQPERCRCESDSLVDLMEALLTANASGSDLPGASEFLRLYYENELKNLISNQQKSPEKTSMSHVIALTTLTATAGVISLAFAPAGIAFGLLVLGAGLVARD